MQTKKQISPELSNYEADSLQASFLSEKTSSTGLSQMTRPTSNHYHSAAKVVGQE
jgi:hypothetical protein